MIRIYKNNLQRLACQFNVIVRDKSNKITQKVADISTEEPLSPVVLTRCVGSYYSKWQAILEKHPELKSLKPKDVANTAELLKGLNYSVEDILSRPMILYNNVLTLENRYGVMKECGFEEITIAKLTKYVAVMNKTVTLLKSHGYLPYDLNVIKRLKACFSDLNLQIPDAYQCNENMELKMIRQNLLNCYFRQHLDMTESDINKIWKVYSRVRHKNFKSIQNMVKLLLEDLEFSKERIVKNGYLLHGDAENIRRIFKEIPTIDGQDIREIVYRRPKILMSSCESLQKSIEYVKTFGIKEDSILKCLEILTLGPDTILNRLRDLHEVEEFQVLYTNPRILRLVHHQNKARLRLQYLNQLKVRCASLHILSCGSEIFERFARDGTDRTKGRDIVVYLTKTMQKDEVLIRNYLSRHPNWCQVPVLQVKQCYEYLLRKKFHIEDIYQNIHLLFYPIKRIEEKLIQLQTKDFAEIMYPINVKEFTNNQILTLILYLIECEYHFTGDGIWTDQHIQQMENFNNVLPDFPDSLNKIYKYGLNSTNSKTEKSEIKQS